MNLNPLNVILYQVFRIAMCMSVGLFCAQLTAQDRTVIGAPGVQSAPKQKTLMVLGDGFSSAVGIPDNQVWVKRLERLMLKQGLSYRIVNVSEAGMTTQDGLAKLPELLEAHQPDWVFVILGMEDALKGKPILQVSKNLSLIIQITQQRGVQVVLFGMQLASRKDEQYSESFSASYAQLARQHQMVYLPNFLEGISDKEALMQDSGIHPNLAAQPNILRNVWRVVGPELMLSQPVD